MKAYVRQLSQIIRYETFPRMDINWIQDYRKHLSAKKSPGIDRIPNKAITLLGEAKLLELLHVSNAIIRFQYFPRCWNQAVIVTIPKGDKDPTQLVNRRPISLLNSCAKLIEAFMKDHLQDYVEEKEILPDAQFGFRKYLSAIQQASNLVREAMDFRKPRTQVMAVLLDVEKAYDRVWRDGLLYKMERRKIPDWLIKLTSSWLQERNFQVKWGRSLSTSRVATEGLPQGSPISPCLFNIFVSDLPGMVKDNRTSILQFADDTAIVVKGQSVHAVQDKMEKVLKTVTQYTTRWKIRLNVSKTEAILFGTKRPSYPFVWFTGHKVKMKSSVVYLGIKIDRTLNFLGHVKRRAALAYKRTSRLYLMLRQDSKLGMHCRLLLLKSVMIPIAFYGVEIAIEGSEAAKAQLVRVQNKLRRKAIAAPYYIRNVDIARDLGLEDILEIGKRRRIDMITRLSNHHIQTIGKLAERLEVLQ